MGMIYLLLAAELLEKSYKSNTSKFIRLSEIHYHRSLLRHYADAMTNHRCAIKAHLILIMKQVSTLVRGRLHPIRLSGAVAVVIYYGVQSKSGENSVD